MAEPQILSLPLDEELNAALQAAAVWRDMSVEDFALSAIREAARMDGELAAFVQQGIDSADRGDVYSQEEMEAWFEARYRSAAAE
ncbi:hypothetical protein FSB78_00975 [Sphingomonas ginsenosidivorax]|uniref:CopG family transcriptional regulator n=1 Tax=Sphingomonas ginsenosidivorax TaxID=862135 RepID=A0A5C6U9L0_9SPHN|nr:hypothetical protein [Sphingomonas ginsenosidivorax]TXC69693.1 hypothetical protein FSB78_00975 [Sphingomonas ginsenosidivorax]